MVVSEFKLYKNGVTQKSTATSIDDDILNSLIRSNPNKEKIEHLRSLPYDGKEYQALKSTLPFVTVHAVHEGINRQKECFKAFTGTLFFDIDHKDMPAGTDLMELKSTIIKDYGRYIYRLGISVGGSGLFFHVKLKNPEKLTRNNFAAIHDYYRNNIFKDLPIDHKVKDIERPQFISYDPTLYVNAKALTVVPEYLFTETEVIEKRLGSMYNKKTEQMYTTNPTFPFDRIIPIGELMEEMVTETPHPLKDDFETPCLVQSLPYARINYKQKIVDGRRHSTLKNIMVKVMQLNPTWIEQQIFSYLSYINQRNCIEKLPMNDLYRMFCNWYESIKANGIDLEYKTVWTNPNFKNRRKISAVENGKLKIEKLLAGVTVVIQDLMPAGTKITQKAIAEHSHGAIKIDRIKRNWAAIKELIATLQNNEVMEQHIESSHENEALEAPANDEQAIPKRLSFKEFQQSEYEAGRAWLFKAMGQDEYSKYLKKYDEKYKTVDSLII